MFTAAERDLLVARLMAKVTVIPGGCWLMRQKSAVANYGALFHRGEKLKCHRLAYELFRGPIAGGMSVLHSCDKRECVNPLHLRLGTQKDNGDDMAKRKRAHKARITHCARGHEFTQENTRLDAIGKRVRRVCRTCARQNNRKHKGYTGEGRWPQTQMAQVANP